MSIVDEKYETLSPKKGYLTDPVVLAQAWKKAHTYIRRHNWYADVLELDISTLNLEKKLSTWSDILSNNEYKPDELRLVPAPKTSTWVFPENENVLWRPMMKSDDPTKEDFSLRPLAHLNIRDQTVATSVMLCLANAIETLQGPTEEMDFLKAQQRQIFNYGNRLQCRWENGNNGKQIAIFGWGNSKCYRMYYEDYQQFLKRPKFMCLHYHSTEQRGRKLYVITLDLKKFYDRVDRKALINETKKLYRKYTKEYRMDNSLTDDESFWTIMNNVFSWKWNQKDEDQSKEIFNTEKLPEGIPQGLVAGGFFANIYMIEFDQKIGSHLHTELQSQDSECNFILRDYCRYVDDIRIVVEANEKCSPESLKEGVSQFVRNLLKQHLLSINAYKENEELNLDINKGKTKIQSFQEISSQNDLSARMSMIQGMVSGTPDIDSLKQVIGDLDSLLQLSEQLNDFSQNSSNMLALSRIATPKIDVKSDTLKRFAAKRLVDVLRMQKGMTVSDENVVVIEQQSLKRTADELIDHDFEFYARKLVANWARNPSLSSLLKFGLDLYPDPSLLNMVLDALSSKLVKYPSNHTNTIQQKLAMAYIAADLLCSCSVWIGYHPKHYYQKDVDLESFREILALFARNILDKTGEFPWYLNQQAALYLASLGQPYTITNIAGHKEMRHYTSLHQSLHYETVNITNVNMLEEYLVTALVIQQLNPEPARFALWFSGLFV